MGGSSIQQGNRLGAVVESELGPCGRFEYLLEGAVAAGQGAEGVRPFVHEPLALVHAGHLDPLGQALVGDLLAEEPQGDYSHCTATGLEHRVGQGAHHSDAGPSVDEVHTCGGQCLTQITGQGVDGVVGAWP